MPNFGQAWWQKMTKSSNFERLSKSNAKAMFKFCQFLIKFARRWPNLKNFAKLNELWWNVASGESPRDQRGSQIAQVGAKLRSTWGQVEANLGSKSASKLHDFVYFVSDGVLEPLGVDVEGVLVVKIGFKSVVKRRSLKTWKLAFRLDESAIFEVPRGFKSIKNRCQNNLKMRSQLEDEKHTKNHPTCAPKTCQDEAKRLEKCITK